MIVVIIAGGSGTRLWPLSTPDFPKHLLSLEGDESLLQNAYRRASMLADAIYIVTDVSHAHHVREQLPKLAKDAIVVEPGRRGTANCVLAGLHFISQRHKADEPIAFIAADHFVRDADGFAQSFHVAAKAATQYKRVCLVGVEPTYPSTGFGYIEKAGLVEDEDMVYNVARFKEKPPHDVALGYVKSGHYLWNCSYFVGSLDTFMATIKTYSPIMQANYEKLAATKSEDEFKDVYLAFKPDTIDFALSDFVDNYLVVPATFDWMDVGSFQDLYDVSDADEQGNAVRGGKVILDDVQNSLVRNEEDKPLAVIGLDNVVVVNTANGIVVARKDVAPRVGEAAKRFNAL